MDGYCKYIQNYFIITENIYRNQKFRELVIQNRHISCIMYQRTTVIICQSYIRNQDIHVGPHGQLAPPLLTGDTGQGVPRLTPIVASYIVHNSDTPSKQFFYNNQKS